jgi:hypothetical protein
VITVSAVWASPGFPRRNAPHRTVCAARSPAPAARWTARSTLLAGLTANRALLEQLLAEHLPAVGYIRFATHPDILTEAIIRMAESLNRLAT